MIKQHLAKIIIGLLVVLVVGIGLVYLDTKDKAEADKAALLALQAQAEKKQEIAPPPPAPIEEVETVDTTPPKIVNSCFLSLSGGSKNEEVVCIRIDSWSGYLDSTNSVPITGKVSGSVKSITVDGKKITWDEKGEIYQRINLYIYGGLNKYKVVAEDMNGNKSTGYVETDAQNNDNDIDINVNE